MENGIVTALVGGGVTLIGGTIRFLTKGAARKVAGVAAIFGFGLILFGLYRAEQTPISPALAAQDSASPSSPSASAPSSNPCRISLMKIEGTLANNKITTSVKGYGAGQVPCVLDASPTAKVTGNEMNSTVDAGKQP